jgi:hypothetical protein
MKCRTFVPRDLPEPARNVILRLFLAGRLADDFGSAELNQFSRQEETGVVCDSRRLPQMMGRNHNRTIFFQVKQQFLGSSAA